MFGNNSIAKIFSAENQGNYTVCSISISKKNKATNKYESTFESKFVRFVGDAHLQKPMAGQKIKITNCGVQNVYYNRDGEKCYLKNPSYCVFGYELLESQNQHDNTPLRDIADDLESSLPF